ncbi:MAG: hypothetical protein U5J63_04815 [Fodinibius sp.]|nr:hypothetical protein [Fodinibius sp.]
MAVASFITSCTYFFGPTPVDKLLSTDADINLEYYEESAPSDSGSTSVLVLGTSHLSRKDQEVDSSEVNRVTSAIAKYNPDVVAVEHLPSDYPRGKGRDYRFDFSLQKYAQQWDMSLSKADSIVNTYQEVKVRRLIPASLLRAISYNMILQMHSITGIRMRAQVFGNTRRLRNGLTIGQKLKTFAWVIP